MKTNDETSFKPTETSFKSNETNILIFISLGLIIGSIFFISYEFYSVKTSCEDLGFEYEFNFPEEHLCNNKTFYKYNTGWDFLKEINYSKLILP